VTTNEILERRLTAQLLAGSMMQTPGEVVAWLGGVQAQDYEGGLWSVGLRQPRLTAAAVARAIIDGTVVRTWAMRGTLHFVAGKDVRWLLALLAPHVRAGNARRYLQLGLDDAVFARSNAVLRAVLADGRHRSRRELAGILERSGISAAGQRAPYLLQRATLDLVICQCGMDGREPLFTLLDAWVPAGTSFGRDEVAAELVRRYVTSHGPAMLEDIRWWSGLPTAIVRAALGVAAPPLLCATSDAAAYWCAPCAPGTIVSAAHLLPPFDEYALGYRDRRPQLEAAYTKLVNAGGGMPRATVVVDGRIVGTWRRVGGTGKTIITVEAFSQVSESTQAALGAAADRLGSFLEMPLFLASATSTSPQGRSS
jgi:hypothetical protein